ncbi:MAG: acyl-CoA dehydratase activase, partial [Chloroflexota bacterium]|nr:acyl-CoA dehydratase activase [Chloroflexota bacterium]
MATIGMDIGSLTTKSVILDASNILSCNSLLTGEDASQSATRAIEQTLKEAGLSLNDINSIVSTGIGKSEIPYPAEMATELRCDVIGSIFLQPSIRGVVDIGAESCRAIKCNQKGNVVDFALNDKCASGTGIFLDTMAKALRITVDELKELPQVEQEVSVTSTCAVFAESEVVSLVHKGVNRFDIWRGVNKSIANRIFALVSRLRIEGDIGIIGGVARNQGVITLLQQMLGDKLIVL